MICYKYKFIFIHVPKNAGTSVRKAIRKHLRTRPQKLRDTLGRPFASMSYHHKKYPPHFAGHEYQDALGDAVFDSYRRFAVVRNPWDWHVSLYAYMQQDAKHSQHDIVRDMDFGDYVRWRCAEDPTGQLPYIQDRDGKICTTDLARFENVATEFNAFAKSVGLDEQLPHRNKSEHKPYRDYYDDRTIQMIADLSQDDIKTFDYSF